MKTVKKIAMLLGLFIFTIRCVDAANQGFDVHDLRSSIRFHYEAALAKGMPCTEAALLALSTVRSENLFAKEKEIKSKRVREEKSTFVRPLTTQDIAKHYKKRMEQLEGKTICTMEGADTGIDQWFTIFGRFLHLQGRKEEYSRMAAGDLIKEISKEITTNEKRTLNRMLEKIMMENASHWLDKDVLDTFHEFYQIVNEEEPVEYLKREISAKQLLEVLNMDIIIQELVQDLRERSQWIEWKNVVPSEKCEELGQNHGQFYKNVGLCVQVHLEVLKFDQKHINLILAKIAENVEKNNFDKEGALKSISKLGVYLYTAPSEEGGPFAEVNAALSTDDPAEFQRLEHVINLIGLGFYNLWKEGTLRAKLGEPYYRGMKHLTDSQFESFQKLLEENKPFRWPQFVSTTADIEVAKKFAREDFDAEGTPPAEESVIFEIHINEETEAIDVDTFSHFKNEEKEILIFPYKQFKVLEISPRDFPGRGVICIIADES